MVTGTRLDDFEDVSTWTAVTPGVSRLAISRERDALGASMRLDFDFQAAAGFAVARRALTLPLVLAEAFALELDIRASGPWNTLEIKLIDPGGQNVWWYREKDPGDMTNWRRLRIRASQFEFAWGPAGGGAIRELGAVEFAVVGTPGAGRGSVWLRELRVEDLGITAAPVIRVSSNPGGQPLDSLLDRQGSTGWRSAPDEPQWLEIDFQGEREYGGLVLHWAQGARARAFTVQTSNDGSSWTSVWSAVRADAKCSYVYMPGTCARYLRLDLQRSVEGRGFGIACIDVRPHEFSRSMQTFFQGVAQYDARRGSYPRYLYGEQSYWTPVGVPDGQTCALLNEEGMVEVDQGTFSIEPFLFSDGRLLTWADCETTAQLERGELPIPTSVWRADALVLRTTAFAARVGARPVLFIRYRVENASLARRSVRLFAACRPFQATPPWQAVGDIGGVSRTTTIERTEGVVWVDQDRAVVPLTQPDAFGAAAFEQQPLVDSLRLGSVPAEPRVSDAFGGASAALCFELDLPASSQRDVHLAIPFGAIDAPTLRTLLPLDGERAFEQAVAQWEDTLGPPMIELAERWQEYARSMRTAAAHILVNRDGPSLQPGPRRYARSWIRDGAIMAAALLRMGCTAPALEYARWYARFQADDGAVPCMVDRKGADWLVEHDSHGELIYTIAECFRFTADRSFLQDMWPAVVKAAGHIERLRSQRLAPEYDTPGLRARRGLLPESASHEGYLAHPVHAYWDDFWAVRALGDAAFLADALGEHARSRELVTLRDAFRASLRESIDATLVECRLDCIPGCVELGDFDPTATANAVSPLDELASLPRAALDRTFERFLARFRLRSRGEVEWDKFTAYEIRIVGALVRLGEREAAFELAQYLLQQRRPPAWNQWPEISWRDPRSPGHIGDIPHTWIGAEHVIALRTMLAYERDSDRALVVAAGVPAEWLDDGASVVVRRLPTWHGALSYTLTRSGSDALSCTLRCERVPPGGIVLAPPLPRALARVEIDGRAHDAFDAQGVTLYAAAAHAVLRY